MHLKITPPMSRRACLRRLTAPVLGGLAVIAQAGTSAAWQAMAVPGAIVLFRHALAPGGGDPAGFQAGDCSTQRNLSAEGRLQATRMGAAMRQNAVKVGAVWHSAWCRTRDTAQLAFPEMGPLVLRAEPAFNSFFSDRDGAPAQTAAARNLLLAWPGPGALVVVTHQVNITALTGIVPQSAEGVVVHREGGRLVVKGQIYGG